MESLNRFIAGEPMNPRRTHCQVAVELEANALLQHTPSDSAPRRGHHIVMASTWS